MRFRTTIKATKKIAERSRDSSAKRTQTRKVGIITDKSSLHLRLQISVLIDF